MVADRAFRRRLIAIALIGVSQAGVGCVTAKASGPRGTGVAPMSARDLRHDARLLAMLDVRRADTLLVDTLLVDADPDRRARTALAIGQLR
ncbi:MAG: hypothetical protein RLZZ97_799, partial [Gemmatimonadota bacterium]